MFNNKQESLFDTKQKASAATANSSAFIQTGVKESAKTTKFGNHAVKFETTGDDFVDQFAKATNFRKPRTYAEVDVDMRLLYSQNRQMTAALSFYLRMITRTTVLPNGEKTETTQRGQGLKHEGRLRMIWLHMNDEELFWKNIPLYISIGSWNDIIQMLSYDLQYNGWAERKLNWDKFGKLILAGLENPIHSELLKKYLPQIKANKFCKTTSSQADNLIGKWICSLLFGNKGEENGWTYKKYRQLKTGGTAHEWQKLISQGKHELVNFDSVHGRALALMVSGKYLANNGLEQRYEEWISSKPTAKFTGYVYELFTSVKSGYTNKNIKKYQADTINAQFMGLIEVAKNGMKENDAGLLPVVDTSSSMTGLIPGTKVSAYDVAKTMALYFSYLLQGRFAGAWMEFNNEAKLKQWKGDTPVAKLQNDRSEAYGGTNFQSVTALFIDIKKQGVDESEFPNGILCLSDGCFNNSGNNKTETLAMKHSLLNAGFTKEFVDNFKIILWDMPNNHYGSAPQTAFEEFADCPNLYHISGLDGSAIAFLTGVEKQESTPKNSEELFLAAMNQQVLNLIEM